MLEIMTNTNDPQAELRSVNIRLTALIARGHYDAAFAAAHEWLAKSNAFFESPPTEEHVKFCATMDLIYEVVQPVFVGRRQPKPQAWLNQAERFRRYRAVPAHYGRIAS